MSTRPDTGIFYRAQSYAVLPYAVKFVHRLVENAKRLHIDCFNLLDNLTAVNIQTVVAKLKSSIPEEHHITIVMR